MDGSLRRFGILIDTGMIAEWAVMTEPGRNICLVVDIDPVTMIDAAMHDKFGVGTVVESDRMMDQLHDGGGLE